MYYPIIYIMEKLSKITLLGTLEGWRCRGQQKKKKLTGREKVLDGQYQRVDIPAHARTAPKGLLQKRLEKDFY